MLHNRNTVGLHISPGKHGRVHYEKYHDRGESCPVAISLGHHPLFLALAGTPVAYTEYNYIGAVAGEPVPVIT
jgi:4-hydroxy-3-polyprenylbenzoate decarboxylase